MSGVRAITRYAACFAVGLLVATTSSLADPIIGNPGATFPVLPKISVGSSHMLLVKTDGTLWSWGWNAQGQLGTKGSTTATPTQVTSLSGVVSAVARTGFSMALKADGTVWVWGQQGNGWMGPTDASSNVPIQVAGLSGMIGIEASWGSTAFAIDRTGKVYGWGRNSYGELGTGSATPAKVTIPQVIGGLSNIVDVRAADTTVLALNTSGTVFQWANLNQPDPIVSVAGVSGATAIGADAINNSNALFAVLGTGEVMYWGDTNSGASRCGQSGGIVISQSGVSVYKPDKLTGFSNIATVSSGPDGEDIFLDKLGLAWTCGGSGSGQQGDGTSVGTSSSKVGPLAVVQGRRFWNVSMGKSAAGIDLIGSVWTWGPKGSGVQGDGDLNGSGANLAPVEIGINAGNPAGVIGPIFAGTQGVANADGTSSLDVGVMLTPGHWSTIPVKVYLAALLPGGQLYLYGAGVGWQAFDPARELPAAYSGAVAGMYPMSIGTADYRSLAGTQILVGYGLGSGTAADAEMLTKGRYKSVLTLR